MSKSLMFVVAAAGLLALPQFLRADDPSFRADRKITGEYFRPHAAGAYHDGAISHSEALEYYGRRYNQATVETTEAHVNEIHHNLSAAQQEFAKFGKEVAGDVELETHVKKIQDHQAKAAELVKKLKSGVNNPKLLSQYSSSIAAELKAAETENDLLKKSLGARQDAKPVK